MAGDSSLEQIKERISIVDLVGERVKLTRSGRNFKGLCPFHAEKTPSFYAFPDRDTWHCFGCGLGGDAFSFVMRVENIEFAEALRALAQRAGVELRAPTSRQAEADRFRRLYDATAATSRFFHSHLFGPEGVSALQYLEQRGVSQDSVRAFDIGWSPASWDALLVHLGKSGFTPQELFEAGLVVQRDTGGFYDRFRSRLVFTIRDAQGRPIGFGGRTLGEEQPKYLNSADSPIFNKGATLFAIDRARAAIRRTSEAIVVEGYVDAIIAHQAGFENVVAALGTALTERHFQNLKRLAPRVVLALDADAAGDAAALRALETARTMAGGIATPIADRRGLVRLRRGQDLDLRVARMPAGTDPDEVILRSPDEFREAISRAVPVLDVLVESEIARAGSDVAQRARAVDAILEVLRDLGNPVLAEQYISALASRFEIDPGAIRQRFRGSRIAGQRPSAAVEVAPIRPTERDWVTLEEYLLNLLFRHPASREILRDLDADDFYREDARAVFVWLRDRILAGSADLDPAADLYESLGDYALWLASWGADLLEQDDPRAADESLAVLRRLRMLNYRREVALIGAFCRDAEREAFVDVVPQRERIRSLVAEIAVLERETANRYNPPWTLVIRDEARIGLLRTIGHPERSQEAIAAAG
ncbi:MAG: DNA primase [Chloroflexi bacterium]|nr:DNA primase [Chloroflexota bacterium]